MALTLNTPSSTGRVGPGTTCQVHDSAIGPFPVDDVFVVSFQNGADVIIAGAVRTGGLNDVNVTMGAGVNPNGPIDYGTYPWYKALSDGTALALSVARYHANGTLVSSNVYGSYGFWDPTSHSFVLARDAGASSVSLLNQILALVQRIWPPS